MYRTTHQHIPSMTTLVLLLAFVSSSKTVSADESARALFDFGIEAEHRKSESNGIKNDNGSEYDYSDESMGVTLNMFLAENTLLYLLTIGGEMDVETRSSEWTFDRELDLDRNQTRLSLWFGARGIDPSNKNVHLQVLIGPSFMRRDLHDKREILAGVSISLNADFIDDSIGRGPNFAVFWRLNIDYYDNENYSYESRGAYQFFFFDGKFGCGGFISVRGEQEQANGLDLDQSHKNIGLLVRAGRFFECSASILIPDLSDTDVKTPNNVHFKFEDVKGGQLQLVFKF